SSVCGRFLYLFSFFFFQAEDGIRDDLVTGVQTCALPISVLDSEGEPLRLGLSGEPDLVVPNQMEAEELVGFEFEATQDHVLALRSEERRVGKECRYRWAT